MATTPDVDESAGLAGAEESMSLEGMVTELDQGGIVILDVSSEIGKNLRQRLHEVRPDFVENIEDEQSSFSIPSADGSPGSPVTVSANLERGTWDDLRASGDSDWFRGSAPFTLKERSKDFDFELRVEPFYKVEGEDIVVKLVLSNTSWSSNMERDDKERRGFFADTVNICLTPMWQKDDRSPKNFSPAPVNDSAQLGVMNQASMGVMASASNPMIVGSRTRGKSQLVNVRYWLPNWTGGHDGNATFTWSLNLWCPVAGRVALYKVEASEKRENADWAKFTDVPELPPAYQKGEFNGFDDPLPSVQWRVKESTFRRNKLSWNVLVKVHSSCFWVNHGLMNVGKVMKRFRGLKWKQRDLIITSNKHISLTPSRNALSGITHGLNPVWIISLMLVAVLVAWELGLRDFFL